MSAAIKATREVVTNYWQLFVNRRAHTVQSMRPHPETGRHYFRPTKEGTDRPPMLTEGTIRQHLEGKITVGLYAINPQPSAVNGLPSMPTTRTPWKNDYSPTFAKIRQM
jgi:hypothetical protein